MPFIGSLGLFLEPRQGSCQVLRGREQELRAWATEPEVKASLSSSLAGQPLTALQNLFVPHFP